MELNLSAVLRAVAATVADRDAIVRGTRRWTYRDLIDRSDRFAHLLLAAGLGCRRERPDLARWQSGQDHVALLLRNGPEFLEAMLGAFAARAAPFNANYRYGVDELAHLLADADARAVVFHSALAGVVDAVRARQGPLALLLQVEDGSGQALLPGARWYHEALASAASGPPPVTPSPDDLYVLYTGGTTGRPKAVLWRQADIYPAAIGGRDPSTGQEWTDLAAVVGQVADQPTRVLPAAPLIHGAAQWFTLNALGSGHTVVLPERSTFDPSDTWQTVVDHRVSVVSIVGDAFARLLLDDLAAHHRDLSTLVLVVSGGAPLSAPVKEALLEHLPGAAVLDALGASEAGQLATQVTGTSGRAHSGRYTLGPRAVVLTEDVSRVADPGDDGIGWLAQGGRVPLGYLGDRATTELTFPTIDGVRYAIPGDRVQLTGDGSITMHGRHSATINSGGEKIFAEEVEAALVEHPAVHDAVVTGRESARWGEEVVAIVQLRAGGEATAADLRAACGERIARYKVPKAIVFVDHIERSTAGKADRAWARALSASLVAPPTPRPSPDGEKDAGSVSLP